MALPSQVHLLERPAIGETTEQVGDHERECLPVCQETQAEHQKRLIISVVARMIPIIIVTCYK